MQCLELGDYVGAESCFHFVGADLDYGMSSRRLGRGDCDGGEVKMREKGVVKRSSKEFPPPIPWLARTGNSPSSKMPWVLRRYYTEDGRLIITGEKADRHEYFEAHRSDGRLRLHLVPLNVLSPREPAVDGPDDGVVSEEEEEEEEIRGGGIVGDGCDGAGGVDDRTAATFEDRSAMMNGGSVISDVVRGGGVGGGNKCSNSVMFGMAVTAIPPVHT